MPLYTKIKIILILLLSIIIAFLTHNYLKSLRDETTVVIAIQEIKERTLITPEMLKEIGVRNREKELLIPNAVSSLEEMEFAVALKDIQTGSVINRLNDVIAGTKQSLVENKVINEDGEINNSYFISNNMRIMTMEVDSQGAVNNTLKAGDWIDIICTLDTENEGNFSNTILQHIKIYEVKDILEEEEKASPQNISVILTPQQAVDLAFAKRNGL
ncbi:MAG: RcpC/CpaB family pilus assembly protein, partial [Clostridia bacterium]|nr:RcpC/CpaB family pilus assembly protein [Clostridia bacterium]